MDGGLGGMRRRGPRLITSCTALLLAALLVAGCARGPATQRPAPALTAEVREATFDRYWEELRRHYPFFDIAGVDWNAERHRWRTAAVRARTPTEFYAVLASMLSGLSDPHVALRPATRWTQDRVSSPDLGVVWVDRRLYVRRWPDGARIISGSGPHGAPALQDGGDHLDPDSLDSLAEVLTVADVRPQRNMLPLVLSGPEGSELQLHVRWADGRDAVVALTRPAAEFSSGAREGQAEPVQVIHPPLMAGTVLEHLSTAEQEVRIRWNDGTESWLRPSVAFTRVLVAEQLPAAPAAVPDQTRQAHTPPSVSGAASLVALRESGPGPGSVSIQKQEWGDWLTVADLADLGYIRLGTLDYDDGEEKVALKDLIAAFDAALNTVVDRPALVLDLRYNGGGRPKSLAAVAGRFVPRRTELASPERKFLGVWPYRYSTRIDPRAPVYTGRLAVLINGETGSAAEHLALILRREAGARIVGERSSGAEALVEVVRGPDGSELRYGWLRFLDEHGNGIQGVGVVPDVEVKLTIERVREVGYAQAVREVELAQFLAACAAIGIDGASALGVQHPRREQAEASK